ncbi:MAG: LysM peptidoglycan-binding domain-containing protein [Syntrophales bacterium]|nr:LysM peptidoglycan-binding domain-containing protein [Syntrophales bacterium]
MKYKKYRRSKRSSMVRLILIGFIFFFCPVFTSHLPAQEATAHLVFKKKASPPPKKEVSEYTVKPNETLIIIVSRQLGIKKERMRFIYKEVLPLNPGLKNANLIYPGQKLYLPLIQGEMREFTDSRPRQNLLLIKAIIEKLGGNLSLSGQHIIPLGEAGQVSLNCAHVPVVDFPNGTVVLLDLKGHLKRDVKNLISQSWPSYRVVTVDPKWDSLEILSRVINTSAPGQTMAPIRPDLPLKNGLRLTIPDSWLISGSKRLVIYCADPRDERLPAVIKKLLIQQGMDVLEIQGEKLVPLELEQTDLPMEPLPHLKAETPEGFVVEVLRLLGYGPTQVNEIPFFTLSEDGFTLHIPAICTLEKEGETVVFTNRTLPLQFRQIMKKKGIKAVSLSLTDRTQTIREIAHSLHLPWAIALKEFNLTPPGYRKKFAVTCPILTLSRTPSGPVHLISFHLDEVLYAFIKQQSNLGLIRY